MPDPTEPLAFTDADGSEWGLLAWSRSDDRRHPAQLPDLIAALTPRGYAVVPVLEAELTESPEAFAERLASKVYANAWHNFDGPGAIRERDGALFLAGSASRQPEIDRLEAIIQRGSPGLASGESINEPAPKPETATQYGDDDAGDPGCEVCGVPTFGARCSKHLHTPEEINAAADAEPAEEEEPKPETAEVGPNGDTCHECGLPEAVPGDHAHALPWRLDSDGKTMLDSDDGSVAEFTTRADAELAAIRCNATQRAEPVAHAIDSRELKHVYEAASLLRCLELQGAWYGFENASQCNRFDAWREVDRRLASYGFEEPVAQGVSRERVEALRDEAREQRDDWKKRLDLVGAGHTEVASCRAGYRVWGYVFECLEGLLAASPDGEQGGGR
jgi:hypothetical protein